MSKKVVKDASDRLAELRELKRKQKTGELTVAEAGKLGGLTTSAKYGHEFFVEIGYKGGQAVKDLIAAGRKVKDAESAK